MPVHDFDLNIICFIFGIDPDIFISSPSVIKMSFNLYDLNAGLDSDDSICFSRKAILYDKSAVNKLVHDHRENLNHYSAKAIMFFILRELKHDVVSEVRIVDVGYGDLFDISTNVFYEFETTGCKSVQRRVNDIYRQTGVEIIVIDVQDLPDDIFQRYFKLKEFVVPD